MQADDLANRFNYHAPRDEATKQAHESVRRQCLNLANWIDSLVPEGREKSLAITHLEETMMWANAGIARSH
jgi:hypothetical protein